MGGWGSGRQSSRKTVEACLTVNLFRLRQKRLLILGKPGRLSWHRSGNGEEVGSIGYTYWGDRLELRFNVGSKPVRQDIPMTSTACHYGGERSWLQCPGCQRRVATLHMKDCLFLCRRCNDLAYAVQREDIWDRAIRAQRRVLQKLSAGDLSIDQEWFSPPQRPKGMHDRTYRRHCTAAKRAHLRQSEAYYKLLVDLLKRNGG